MLDFMNANGGNMPEERSLRLVLEPTMAALAYIHSLGMIHSEASGRCCMQCQAACKRGMDCNSLFSKTNCSIYMSQRREAREHSLHSCA